MLCFDKLICTIDNKNLFSDLSLCLLPSSILYILGANGSGKTSLLRSTAGIGSSSSGNIYFRGTNIHELPKPYCTYIGHNLGLKPELSVFENLKSHSSFYNSLEALEASIHYFKLHEVLDKKCYELSSGTQKRVALSKLLSCQSDLWLLDEVETNLDAENKHLLNNLIVSKANNGGIILISSHDAPTIKTSQNLYIEDYKIE